MLYELLAGALPFEPSVLREKGFGELLRVIREESPPRMSVRFAALGEARTAIAERRQTDATALRRQLAGDLEWIALKALEKDRTRRYETASTMGTDLRRHLHDEPILARPPGAAYKLRKLAARHKAGFAFVCAIFVLLALFAIAMTLQSTRIAAERNRAVLEAEKANAVNRFMQETLAPRTPSRDSIATSPCSKRWTALPSGSTARSRASRRSPRSSSTRSAPRISGSADMLRRRGCSGLPCGSGSA